MEKENVELDTAAKPEARRSKRRRKALGSMAIEPGHRARRSPVEAHWLHATQPAPERIGHVLVSAGDHAADRKKPLDAIPPELKNRRVETLTRAELMTLSETVAIDGTSLRQIYETHLIGEHGLQRLINEYLHGGDLKQALRLEIVERERDFERDPAMRDMNPDIVDSSLAHANQTLDTLLQQADVTVGGKEEEAAFFKARARFEAKELRQHRQRRRVLDIALGATILILVILVIMLLLNRG